MYDIAKDIMAYSFACKLDATVVGRRGVSKVQEMIMGSVTNNLLEHSEVIPVWVVDDEVKSNKVILSVDGSESSFRAVDHVSFMFKDNTDITITLLHVRPRFGDFVDIDFEPRENEIGDLLIEGEKRRIKNFYSHALKQFNEAGIKENQLHIMDVACSVNVGKTIVSEVEKGNYGTVVIGRSGLNKSFFFGSVSRHVLEKASNCAIWLVP
jgi:nucleotide-binding universal stress UspA family protein